MKKKQNKMLTETHNLNCTNFNNRVMWSEMGTVWKSWGLKGDLKTNLYCVNISKISSLLAKTLINIQLFASIKLSPMRKQKTFTWK